MTLAVWSGRAGPAGLLETSIGVEFRGRLGHPSSYGLIAGEWLSQATEKVAVYQPFTGLTVPVVPGEVVEAGVGEYWPFIVDNCEMLGTSVTITAVVHGIGSSAWVFRRLTKLLVAVLTTPEALDDQALAQLWASSPD